MVVVGVREGGGGEGDSGWGAWGDLLALLQHLHHHLTPSEPETKDNQELFTKAATGKETACTANRVEPPNSSHI